MCSRLLFYGTIINIYTESLWFLVPAYNLEGFYEPIASFGPKIRVP